MYGDQSDGDNNGQHDVLRWVLGPMTSDTSSSASFMYLSALHVKEYASTYSWLQELQSLHNYCLIRGLGMNHPLLIPVPKDILTRDSRLHQEVAHQLPRYGHH